MHYLTQPNKYSPYHLRFEQDLFEKPESELKCKHIAIGPIIPFCFDQAESLKAIKLIGGYYKDFINMRKVNILFFLRVDVLEDFERKNIDVFYRLAWRHSCISRPQRYVEQDELVHSIQFIEEWVAVIQLHFLVMNGFPETSSDILLQKILGSPLIGNGEIY